MIDNREISSFSGPEPLAAAVAKQWLDEMAAWAPGLRHTVALSGGRSATRLFTAMAAQSRARGQGFDGVHFFWADERCVPPDDEESNFRLAQELLFAPLCIPPARIHRLKGEADPESAAREASLELMGVAPVNPAGQPVLDLVLLGLGEDGHVASLFPGMEAAGWRWSAPYMVVRQSPKPPPTRISLSLAAIAAAREAWVLVTGAGKQTALHDSLTAPDRTSLGRVIAARPTTRIFTDTPVIG